MPRHYISQSSLFDTRPYDIPAMRRALSSLIRNPHACRAYGWSNQPRVMTFTLRPGATVKQVQDTLRPLLGDRGPIVMVQDW